ncbi:MAG: PA2169 family four-helix-bundle protein [Gammaproteobacteria bacterium]
MLDRDVVSALNNLIETSKDGEKGFALAVKASKDPALIRMFGEGEQHCRDATAELQDSIRLLGGRADNSGSLKAAAHRGWLSLRNAMNSRDSLAILEECEKGEEYAQTRYADTMKLALPEGVRVMVERQYQGVTANHLRIRDLRNQYRS